jgi:hypothetical protein
MSTAGVSGGLRRTKKGLVALLRRTSGKGVKTINDALELLAYFDLLQDSVDDLWNDLLENNAFHLKNLARFSDDKHGCDLVAAVLAVDAVLTFLQFSPSMSLSVADRSKRFKILVKLRQGLLVLSEGGPPAPMLRPRSSGSGRRADVSLVLAMKGVLAGLMQRQMRAGMTREKAAKWIADNTSPKLAARISRQPITARMVEEWLDRFGGKHANPDIARRTYLVWSQGDGPLTKARFKAITERIGDGEGDL